LPNFCAKGMNACHTGMSRGMSKMLPMRGYPFGPGGYGGLLLFVCHFHTRTKDAAAQSKVASRVLSSIMSRDKLGRGSESGESSIPSDRPRFISSR